MRLFAAFDLQRGRVGMAEAHPGEHEPTVAAQAKRWAQCGLTWAHVTDVDAARGGRQQWHQVAHALGQRLRVQFGGGVRSMTQVQQLLDLGVERVVVGTQAVRNPLWLRELCRIFPGRIVLALDVRAGKLMLGGWREATAIDPLEFVRPLDDAGLAAVLYTPVGHDTTGRPDWDLVHALRKTLRTPLLVGGDLTVGDLQRLEDADVFGAVLGTTIYSGTVEARDVALRFPDKHPEAPRRVRPAPAADEAPDEPADDGEMDEDLEDVWDIADR